MSEGPVGIAVGVRSLARGVYRRAEKLSLPTWALIFFSVVYVEVFTWFSYLRYLGFLTNAWDLGIFQQALWNSGHGGGLLHYTVELPWNPSGSFLGVHFSPILLLLIPIYTAFPGPITLMAVQSIVVAASGFPMFRLASKRIGAWPGLTLAGLYLMSPPMIGGLLFDFHVEAFLPLAALTLWVAWEERRYRLAVVAGAFLLGTLEYAPVILGAIAFGFLVRRYLEARRTPATSPRIDRWRPMLRPLAITVISLPLTLIFFLIPKLVSPTTPPVSQVGPLGGSPTQILVNAVTRPDLVAGALRLHWAHKVQYLQALWGTGLYAWPFAPLGVLPAAPWILLALVSEDPNYSVGVGNQYAFLVTPFLFVGTAFSLGWVWQRRHRALSWARRALSPIVPPRSRVIAGSPLPVPRRRPPWRRPEILLAGILLVAAVPGQMGYSPLSPTVHYSWLWSGQFPTAHDHLRQAILDLVPPDASVSAEPDMFPQVADRSNAYPYYVQGTEFAIFDVTSWWFTTALPAPMPPDQWLEEMRQNVSLPYGVYASADGIVLLKLGYTGLPVFYEPYDRVLGATSFNVVNATIELDPTAPRGAYISPTPGPASGRLWTGPNALVPAGSYSVALWVHAAAVGSGSIRITTQILNQTGQNLTLTTVDIPTSSLLAGWSSVTETVVVPYPTYLNVTGQGTGYEPSVEFGGITIAQLPGAVVLGR